ncbi:hypothetical protein QYE76_040886 [Lolium multiflorum]|uniref:Transposase (putative) gypsy type domain-containing protein n=1 Tax=Lolium multiflorum TaxID=4521 RepID=A0AAD8TDM7_LOLMU|nr:hypothetical protein QYE76_040886 [Lolium multiflorum]
MPPRTKLTKHTSPMATKGLQSSEWERSRISNQDVNLLKKLGFTKKENTLIFPGEESYPTPRIGYRVTFVDHLIRGLATPIHEFLRGLLFVYGLQLHHLTPNSILHIAIFITLCEGFLGTPPNWGLWKRIFLVRRNSSHTAYNVGGVVICVRPYVEYVDVKFPDSVQGWRKRWLYVQEAHNDAQEYNVAPFDGGEKIVRRRSWDAEASDEEKTATDALMKCIHELQNTHGKELSGIQITAYFLRIRVLPLQARKNPLWMYAGDKDVDRMSTDLSVKDLERLVRKITSLNKKDPVPSTCRVVPYSGTNALPQTQTFVSAGKMSQDFVLEKPEDNRLLDALSLLEIQADLVGRSIFDAQTAFSRLFPYFFPKKKEPDTFAALAESFVPKEDLGLALRQENFKIGVEGTIALVAKSQQNVDWAKVGEATKMKQDKWPKLIRAAKPHSKKILAFLGYKPTPSSSSAKPEVK